MAGFTICMTAQKQHTLDQLHQRIHRIPGLEMVQALDIPVDQGAVWLLVYERQHLRTGFASLTLLLTEKGQTQQAYLVASGGGVGLSDLSLGANRKLAEECAQALGEMGFREEPALSDRLPKQLLARFLK